MEFLRSLLIYIALNSNDKLNIYLSIYLSRKEAIKSMVALLGSNKLDLFGGTKLIVTLCIKRAVDLK